MKIIYKLAISGIFLSMMVVLALTMPGIAQAQSYGCTYHSSERCSGNYLYWYDSCGNEQDVAQYCQSGCYNNACQNNYNNNNNYNNYNSYGNCTYHAYTGCVGNSVYWYSGCQAQQDLDYNCNGGQVCQYGQCTAYIVNPVLPPIQQVNNYVVQSKTACYNSSIYWYDSLGTVSGLYKSCADNNSCTTDACSGDKCLNTLKCDGSTCAADSTDYKTYCLTTPTNHCGNGLCETTLGETNANCPADCKLNTASALTVSFFAKQDANSSQWQKTTEDVSNGNIYFMISVVNNSTAQVDNVNISTNIPSEISSLGNIKLNNVPISGDIISGINIGSIAPTITKSITFEGKTQTISALETKQATATSNVSGLTQSDSVSISFNPSTAVAAAVASAPATSGFWGFLGRWYLWILAGLILIFLFVMVYRRFSSDV